jgi:hypothetical protein
MANAGVLSKAGRLHDLALFSDFSVICDGFIIQISGMKFCEPTILQIPF